MGSTSTSPAGTNTAQRFESWWSERSRSPAAGRPIAAAGASALRAVSDSGWGTNVAARPTAHPTHRPTDATVRTATSAPCSASAKAGPAVNGSAAHQGEWMAAEVRLVDLAVIKRYSLAVRQERAPAEEVLEALEDSAAIV